MESAIIFGKNRHLYGGLEPSHMPGFGVSLLSGKLELACTLPEDTYIDGQLLCTVAGAVIRSKTDGYPKDEFDGDLVAEITASCVFEDVINSMDSVVYYAAFPYSDQGVYNRSELNRTLYDLDNAGYIFGYDLDTTEPDPDKRVTYPRGVNNANYSPAKMNYSTGVFDYGGWSVVTPGVAFMPKPCMLKFDGTVDYYLDPDDYTKKEDGTASDVSNVDYQGNAMIEWPKIYTKRWEENGIYHFRCSGVKQDDSWDCWCNYDKNDNEIEHFYTSIYLTGSEGIRPRSRSGLGESIEYGRLNYVKNNIGDDWGIDIMADRLLIQDLLVMMARSTDCQTAYGNGDWSCNATTSGSMNTKGMFWGCDNTSDPNGTYGVKIFGMEHWWGGIGRATVGYGHNTRTGQQYIKITRGTHDGSTVSDYNYSSHYGDFDVAGYIELGDIGGQNGYVSGMQTMPFGRIPIRDDGASNRYECDYYFAYKASSHSNAVCTPLIGGISDSLYQSGPFAVNFSDARTSRTSCRSALSCKPSVS